MLVYTALSLAVFIFLLLLHTCIRKRGSAYARANNRRYADDNNNDGDIMLSKLHESRSSASSLGHPPPYAQFQPVVGTAGADGKVVGHQRTESRSQQQYGGGTMPGPQYLLNMHPGVPVQVNRM